MEGGCQVANPIAKLGSQAPEFSHQAFLAKSCLGYSTEKESPFKLACCQDERLLADVGPAAAALPQRCSWHCTSASRCSSFSCKSVNAHSLFAIHFMLQGGTSCRTGALAHFPLEKGPCKIARLSVLDDQGKSAVAFSNFRPLTGRKSTAPFEEVTPCKHILVQADKKRMSSHGESEDQSMERRGEMKGRQGIPAS